MESLYFFGRRPKVDERGPGNWNDRAENPLVVRMAKRWLDLGFAPDVAYRQARREVCLMCLRASESGAKFREIAAVLDVSVPRAREYAMKGERIRLKDEETGRVSNIESDMASTGYLKEIVYFQD